MQRNYNIIFSIFYTLNAVWFLTLSALLWDSGYETISLVEFIVFLIAAPMAVFYLKKAMIKS